MRHIRDTRFIPRLLLFLFGVYVLSLGTVFIINSELGVTPVQSVPMVLSFITEMSIGLCIILVFIVFTIIQILILRQEFEWVQLTQIVLAFLFGFFVDFSNLFVSRIQVPGYFGQLLMLGIGIVLVACGVTLHMRARIITMSPEALTAAITKKVKRWEFYQIRIIQDSILVVISILLSFVFLHGLYGIREGTVICAVMVGKCIQYTSRFIPPILQKLGFKEE